DEHQVEHADPRVDRPTGPVDRRQRQVERRIGCHGARKIAGEVPRMLLATIVSTPYKIVLVLHILAAIIGFGSVLLNGVYASEARKRPGPEGGAIADANYRVSFGIAMYVIYAIPVLG